MSISSAVTQKYTDYHSNMSMQTDCKQTANRLQTGVVYLHKNYNLWIQLNILISHNRCSLSFRNQVNGSQLKRNKTTIQLRCTTTN